MYPNLQKLLRERHISSRMYAAVIETSQGAAANKVRGDSDHTVQESMRAMTLFPEYSYDYVFHWEDGVADEPVETE